MTRYIGLTVGVALLIAALAANWLAASLSIFGVVMVVGSLFLDDGS